MSCQQASRIVANNNINNHNNNNDSDNNSQNIKGNCLTRGVVQSEDPYVFTESISTTPPILFNAQKTRTRLSDLKSTAPLNGGTLQQLPQQKLPSIGINGKITSNSVKAQASFLSAPNPAPIAKNNVKQSLTATAQLHSLGNNCNNKKLSNVCIVRPQLQQQHYHRQQHQHNSLSAYEGDLKSISPPPLYTPPTPSLWQTPLLLETTTTTTTSQVANIASEVLTSQTNPIMGCVTPTVQIVASTATTTNLSSTTTAMAKVAPIIINTPLGPPPSSQLQTNQCLPPSKFHNDTLAQHLKKLDCLKKSKKSTQFDAGSCNENIKSTPLTSHTPTTTTSLLQQTSPSSSRTTALLKMVERASPVKHSDNEVLNEIPVNVIFRMDMVHQQKNEIVNEKSSNNVQFGKPSNNNLNVAPCSVKDTQTELQLKPPLPPSQLKTNLNKKLSVPASKTIAKNQIIKQEINTSSIQQQQQHNATKTVLGYEQQQERQQYKIPAESSELQNSEPLTKVDNETSVLSNLNSKNLTHISNKTRKTNSSSIINFKSDLPNNWQMGCSTSKGAVAVVKMSQHNIDLDTTHLATASGLPYCLQRHWLYSYDFLKSFEFTNKEKNCSLIRDERIAVYKQQLRRQALQLLSARSLQKLPLQIARRRLLCVDRLLRKYQQNKKEYLDNVKRCCIEGCDAFTLEMALHCKRHIVYNSSQHVFLPCTAKFADNTQCRVPVFDITHDLPLCVEHARKRDAYNRLLYEQRPRKISANPISMNDTISSTAGVRGVVIKKQNCQKQQHPLQQQQKQQILQQIPPNNHNDDNSKRPMSANQQTRKRKVTVGSSNPVGRALKRVKKTVEKPATTDHQMQHFTKASLKRKGSTTSLESLASNSQHSTTSSTSQKYQQQQYQRQQTQQQQHAVYGIISSTTTTTTAPTTSLPPPALAPLSSGLVGQGLPQHLFSFSHDNHHRQQQQHQQQLQPIKINDKHSFSPTSVTSATTVATPTELKDFISQFSFASQKNPQTELTADVNLINTNSNSNFTSSGMGSTNSLPTADDFLTQDMLSICENSSASSADTGLGGLSDPELMLGGPEDDIPLDDTHLLEEHDLENVLNSLPEDAFKELFTTVHQDESDEIERAIELADKHLKTLQQTIGSELGDFLDFNDDMLMDNGDLCNGPTIAGNSILDTSALFVGMGSGAVASANATQGGGAVMGSDIRGLVQT